MRALSFEVGSTAATTMPTEATAQTSVKSHTDQARLAGNKITKKGVSAEMHTQKKQKKHRIRTTQNTIKLNNEE